MIRWLLLCLVALALPRIARASEVPAVVALVVGSNHSSVTGRPDLRYADDDAGRYEETFRGVTTHSGDVELLTRFDRDSEALFANARQRARPPTRANLLQSIQRLAQRVQLLRGEGREVDFYFSFAGHGDVDHGRGFLELEDGPFTSADLEGALRVVAPTRTHVLLDSCNSIFVIAARKPGGHVFETGEAAASELAARQPNVGVFLSTSADGEVFEWSELGAGIFSHVVRSGLAGAADADGDLSITYAELRAFVDLATRSVKNPRYRPRVFAVGPKHDDRQVIFRLRQTGTTTRFVLEPRHPRRVTLRDADGVPWLDLHCEPGARCTLLVPPRVARGGTVEIRSSDTEHVLERRRFVESSRDVDGSALQTLTLDDLAPDQDVLAGRGPTELFRALFRTPFGPAAYAAYLQEPERPSVYGVSDVDVQRFRLLLEEASAAQRTRRYASGAGLALSGGIGVGLGTVGAFADSEEARWFSRSQITGGVGALVASVYWLATPSSGERLARDFSSRTRHPEDVARAMAFSETQLFATARTDRRARIALGIVVGAVVAASAATFVVNELRAEPDESLRSLGLLATVYPATLTPFLFPTPVERLANLWRSDSWRPPSIALPRVSFGIAPTLGGATLGLHGSY